MLTPLLIIFNPFTYLIGPIFIIVLALISLLLLKFPSAKGKVGILLVVTGVVEITLAPWGAAAHTWDFTVASATLVIGIALCIFAFIAKAAPAGVFPQKKLAPKNLRLLRRSAFSLVVVAVLVSAVLFSARATNLIREDSVVNFSEQVNSNFKVNGTIASVAFNDEVGNGHSYHLFPAHIILKIAHIIWFDNSTGNHIYSLPQGELTVYYQKADCPSLVIGQPIEINGYYQYWVEDVLYSNMLLVSSNVNGSYLKAL